MQVSFGCGIRLAHTSTVLLYLVWNDVYTWPPYQKFDSCALSDVVLAGTFVPGNSSVFVLVM